MGINGQRLERVRHFYARTNQHIELVKKYALEMLGEFPSMARVVDKHDKSKFDNPEIKPYIDITWFYKCQREKVPFDSDYTEEERQQATVHHIKNNKHHPEYWDPNAGDEAINTKDRDKPAVLVDATKMPGIYVAEMVADWCAVSEERKSDPRKWAKDNIGKRWKFTEEQETLIYRLIDLAWGKSDGSK